MEAISPSNSNVVVTYKFLLTNCMQNTKVLVRRSSLQRHMLWMAARPERSNVNQLAAGIIDLNFFGGDSHQKSVNLSSTGIL